MGTSSPTASIGRSATATGSRQRQLEDPVAQLALETMRAHLEMTEAQLRVIDAQLERIAGEPRWQSGVRVLTSFRGIATLTALSLLAEIGDSAASAARGS